MAEVKDEERQGGGSGGGSLVSEHLKGDRGADLRRALVGGGVAALVAALGVGSTGVATGAEARALLEGIIPTIRFLTSAVITASATILALMLTILSLSVSTERRFRGYHYERVRHVATWSSAAIVLGTVLLLFLSLPLGESEVLREWYQAIFYGIVVTSSILGGILVAVVLLLQRTVSGLVDALHPHGDSSLTVDDDEPGD